MQIEQFNFEKLALDKLYEVFFHKFSYDDFLLKLRKELMLSGRDLRDSNSNVATDLFILKDNGIPVGLALTKYYKYSSICTQLYFKQNESTISLVPFYQLVPSTLNSVCAELAYVWVDPGYRGCGLAKVLLKARMNEITKVLLPEEAVFSLILSSASKSSVGKDLLLYLLRLEKAANSTYPFSNKIIVKGLSVPLAPIEKALSFSVDNFDTNNSSIGAESLVKRLGFKLVGFSNNLSRVYYATLANTKILLDVSADVTSANSALA